MLYSGFLHVGYLEHSDETEKSYLSSVSNVRVSVFSFSYVWHCGTVLYHIVHFYNVFMKCLGFGNYIFLLH